jgi:hypothetical protein
MLWHRAASSVCGLMRFRRFDREFSSPGTNLTRVFPAHRLHRYYLPCLQKATWPPRLVAFSIFWMSAPQAASPPAHLLERSATISSTSGRGIRRRRLATQPLRSLAGIAAAANSERPARRHRRPRNPITSFHHALSVESCQVLWVACLRCHSCLEPANDSYSLSVSRLGINSSWSAMTTASGPA